MPETTACPCESARLRRRASAVGIPMMIVTALLPKCPACVVAYCSLLAVPSAATFVTGPFPFILGGASLLLFLRLALRPGTRLFGALGGVLVVVTTLISRGT